MTVSELFQTNPDQYSRVVVEIDDEIYDDTFYGNGSLLLDSNSSSIEFNRLADSRATGSFSFYANSEEASEVLDPLAGCYVLPYSGVKDGDTVHWEPLGRYMVETTDRNVQAGNNKFSVNVVDLSEKVRDAKWKSPFSTGGGTYNDAIEAIFADRVPLLTPFRVYLSTYAGTTPAVTYTEGEDPWAAIVNLAKSSASEVYFNKRGQMVVSAVPDPATMEPSIILGGSDFRVEIGRRRISVSRRDVFNGVICTGEAPWLLFPIRGEYWDDNPASATYRLGPFGETPYKMGSTVATTDAQCDDIAEAEFRLRAGVSEDVTFTILKDPTLDVGSMVSVVDPGVATKFYTLDTLSYPMGSGPMTGTVRRKRF